MWIIELFIAFRVLVRRMASFVEKIVAIPEEKLSRKLSEKNRRQVLVALGAVELLVMIVSLLVTGDRGSLLREIYYTTSAGGLHSVVLSMLHEQWSDLWSGTGFWIVSGFQVVLTAWVLEECRRAEFKSFSLFLYSTGTAFAGGLLLSRLVILWKMLYHFSNDASRPLLFIIVFLFTVVFCILGGVTALDSLLDSFVVIFVSSLAFVIVGAILELFGVLTAVDTAVSAFMTAIWRILAQPGIKPDMTASEFAESVALGMWLFLVTQIKNVMDSKGVTEAAGKVATAFVISRAQQEQEKRFQQQDDI